MKAIFYVSKSLLPPDVAHRMVCKLVERSVERNEALDVSGCLLFTGRLFVQWIEGPRPNLDLLFQDILDDTRHSEVNVLRASAIERREFSSWRMGYSGSGKAMDKAVTSMVSSRFDHQQKEQSLLRLMNEFLA